MRMRQSLAQWEEAFEQEQTDSVQRRDYLRRQAVDRSRARRVERSARAGTVRFSALCVAILATAVLVTFVMFQALALIAA